MARVPYLAPDEADPDARAVLERIAGDRGDLPNVYRTLANSPQLLVRTVALVEGLWRETKVSRLLQELIILRVAQVTGSNYEWGRHRMLARRLGLPEEQVQDLAAWPASPRFSNSERAALAFTDAVAAQGSVPDEVAAQLAKHFGSDEIVEIAMTAAFYTGFARYLSSMQVELEPGFERLPQ
jgi:AhpD family alkylhydroperoxidase